MLIRIPKGWEIPEREVTPESVYQNRRELLKAAGFGAVGVGMTGLPLLAQGTGQQKQRAVTPAAAAGATPAISPAKRNPKFEEKDITAEWAATNYNNYYELHPTSKEEIGRLAGKFVTSPWKFEVKGGAAKPVTLDLDEVLKTYQQEERVYRFRCVEAWSMVVPWTGFPLSELIKRVGDPNAKFVRFVTVNRPDQLPGMRQAPWYPWPYNEGLRMDEAMNPLTMVVTGIYGKPLPKQNGAPIRIIAPWKYGYKSPKSLATIEFTNTQPKTLWNEMQPEEYGFFSNVNPNKPHPRWSQALERVIPEGNRQRTRMYNGYEEYVAAMYKGNEH